VKSRASVLSQRARLSLTLLACALGALLGACAGPSAIPEPAPEPPFALRILHINDHHSRLGADPGGELSIDGESVQLSFGGFPALTRAIAEHSEQTEHLLKLHAGDAITGDLYFTLFQGEADAELLNSVCFDAFAVGNHEFDTGDAGLAKFLDYLWRDRSRCDTPALGANVHPTPGESALLPAGAPPYLQPSVVLERGGRRIGIVGIDIAGKTKASSSPDEGTRFEDEFSAAQREIDALQAEGVKHILLLTHIGYLNDLELARRLRGVDAIIGGDSHSLLGEGFRAFGLMPAGEYPTRLRNADGDLVCVVQAWQYTWVLGRLELSFDREGRVLDCGGAPLLLVGDDLRRGEDVIEGAERERLLARIEAEPLLQLARPDPVAQAVFERYQDQISEFSAQIVGHVPERLCLRRAPGPYDRSRDGAPGCAEATDVHGGHAQQVVARAFLSLGQRYGGADIALQNGGGVRNGIAAGPFTIGAAYLSLPFKNTLERLHMTGAEIHGVLEDAYDYFVQNPGSNMGAWPYAAGLRWQVDLSRSREQGRVHALEVRSGPHWQPLDPQQTYRVITNDYIAGGRDGFAGLADISGERRQPTYLHYAQALADYAREGGDLSRPTADEMSTQAVVYPPAEG
jgi:5'-nucleotidase / UDP-sugar diphosphatase